MLHFVVCNGLAIDSKKNTYLSARVRMAGVNTGRFTAVLKYGVSDAVVNGIAMPFTTQTAKLSLCEVGGMYGVDINGTTLTVDIGAMTALKRDGSALYRRHS